MSKDVSTTAACKVGAGKVYLTIDIGNGQLGSSTVRFDGSMKIIGNGTVNDLDIGNGPDLQGKKLKVVTTVTNTNPQTNTLVVRYRCSGLVEEPVPSLVESTADISGETVNFITTIQFN